MILYQGIGRHTPQQQQHQQVTTSAKGHEPPKTGKGWHAGQRCRQRREYACQQTRHRRTQTVSPCRDGNFAMGKGRQGFPLETDTHGSKAMTTTNSPSQGMYPLMEDYPRYDQWQIAQEVPPKIPEGLGNSNPTPEKPMHQHQGQHGHQSQGKTQQISPRHIDRVPGVLNGCMPYQSLRLLNQAEPAFREDAPAPLAVINRAFAAPSG